MIENHLEKLYFKEISTQFKRASKAASIKIPDDKDYLDNEYDAAVQG